MNNFLAKLENSWRSATIWVNTAFASLLIFLPDLQAAFPQLQGYLPEGTYKYLMGLIIAANILLRFRTTMALDEKGKK